MTKFSKILVVLVTFGSLAFMGAAAVTALVGPNWHAEAEKETGYVFEKKEGETPTWTVKSRLTGEELKTSRLLAETVIAARKDRISKQQERLEQLDKRIPAVEKALKEARAVQQTDTKGMQQREIQLAQQLAALNQQIDELTNLGIAKADEAQAIRVEAEKRREDVFRLRNQLDEIRSDTFRIAEQKKQLEDQLVRLNGILSRLDRRQQQLKAQLYEKDAPGAKSKPNVPST